MAYNQGYNAPPPGQPVWSTPYYQQPIQQQPGAAATASSTVVVQIGNSNQNENPFDRRNLREWTSGLFSCFNDLKSCCCYIFCRDAAMTQIANRMGESCCVPCCLPGGVVLMRTNMRAKMQIKGSICNDYCATAFCHPCVVCQMSRELDNVGIP